MTRCRGNEADGLASCAKLKEQKLEMAGQVLCSQPGAGLIRSCGPV